VWILEMIFERILEKILGRIGNAATGGQGT
jgi:hypothetical protein